MHFPPVPIPFPGRRKHGNEARSTLLSYLPHGLKRTQTVEKVGGYWPTFQCRSRLRQILDWSRHTCWDGRWGTRQSCQLGDHPLSQTLQCSLSTREHIVNKTLQQCTYLHYHLGTVNSYQRNFHMAKICSYFSHVPFYWPDRYALLVQKPKSHVQSYLC